MLPIHRNERKLRGKIYGASKKQVASLEASKPTMLKLLPSLGLPCSLVLARVSFYHRASSCRGVCQRTTCSGACIWKISPHVNLVKNCRFSYLEHLTPVQKQFSGMERAICTISNFPTRIYYISVCMVTNNNQHCIPCVFLPLVICTMQPNTPLFKYFP